MTRVDVALADPGLQGAVSERLASWSAADFGPRLAAADWTLWSTEPLPELGDRLGWVGLPQEMLPRLGELESFATRVEAAGFERVVVLGMGGSSLAPRVFAESLPAARLRLTVLDSTHPAAVAAVRDAGDLATTLFVVSSKSGTTIETTSLAAYFEACLATAGRDPGPHFVAITDPGTVLERRGHEAGFRRVFSAPADVGGRYSALTPFGLVPAALAGAALEPLLTGACEMASRCGEKVANPGLELGAILGEAALVGRDKLTLVAGKGLEALPLWLEQLVAESLGKRGTGVVPVSGERPSVAASWGGDRLFVGLHLEGGDTSGAELLEAMAAAGEPVVRFTLESALDLGAEMYRWEVATAAAGALLGVNPFDQPDVESAKKKALAAMAGGAAAGGVRPQPLAAGRGEPLDRWLGSATAGDYVVVQAYLPESPAVDRALDRLQARLRERTGLPVGCGYGPRFLHSTGQLHKGGPASGLFLQLVDRPAVDLEVPGHDFSFGKLIRAQALGDAAALAERGRRLLSLELEGDLVAALDAMAESASDA